MEDKWRREYMEDKWRREYMNDPAPTMNVLGQQAERILIQGYSHAPDKFSPMYKGPMIDLALWLASRILERAREEHLGCYQRLEAIIKELTE
jgi:hypothetical protein